MKIAARHTVACFLAVLVPLVAAAGCRAPAGSPDRDAGLDASAAPGAFGGPTRGCDATASACGPGAYCAFEPLLCGKGKRPGACRARPATCADAYAPVCGCDGTIFKSECEAHAAGVDLDVTGACKERVPGWIACGARLCDARTSYCEIVLSDVFELPTDYTCKPLPAACVPVGDVARSCDCFTKGTRCLSFCGYIPTGTLSGFHLTCRR